MAVISFLLAFWVCIGIALSISATIATARHFKKHPQDLTQKPVAMTLIRPVRGLNIHFRENLESIISTDPHQTLQIIIAMESEKDPAYAEATAFAKAHADHDILVAVTGPSRDRMGKIHNMIEACPLAKHPFLIFSDADVRASAELLNETSLAFQEGYDAIYALPQHEKGKGLSATFFQVFFNHNPGVAFAAYAFQHDFFNFYAGAWMAYTREMIDRLGGLPRFENQIADDYALGSAASLAGAKQRLLNVPSIVEEEVSSFKEVFDHFAKWAAIIRSCVPKIYFLFPFLDLPLMSLILFLISVWTHRFPLFLSEILLGVSMIERITCAFCQDISVGGPPLPFWGYLVIPLCDCVGLAIGLMGFKKTILWRGSRYRLRPGGEAEVINQEKI